MATLPLFHGHAARFLAGPRWETTLRLKKGGKEGFGFYKIIGTWICFSVSAYSGFALVVWAYGACGSVPVPDPF